MTEQGRNRLVGAVILIALAAIVLPMLFDGAGIERRAVPEMAERPRAERSMVTEARQEPAVDEAEWAFLEEVEERRAQPGVTALPQERPALPDASALPAEPAPPAERAPPVEDEAPRPGLDAAGLPVAWSVQVASFRELDNARGLRSKLIEDGFEAYLLPGDSGDSSLHRVSVGPRIDRAAAERLCAELQRRYDLDGFVVRFDLGDG